MNDAVADILALAERLEEEIPEKQRSPFGGAGSGKGGHQALASWNAQAAYLLMEIHAGARELEVNLRFQVAGSLRDDRGGSDGNTLAALQALPALAAGLDYAGAKLACRQLEKWAFRARIVLGEVEPFSRVPRMPGMPEALCPFCHSRTLRMKPSTGQVRCVRPGCTDSDGNPSAGHVEVGAYSGEVMLTWADRSVGVQQEA